MLFSSSWSSPSKRLNCEKCIYATFVGVLMGGFGKVADCLVRLYRLLKCCTIVYRKEI